MTTLEKQLKEKLTKEVLAINVLAEVEKKFLLQVISEELSVLDVVSILSFGKEFSTLEPKRSNFLVENLVQEISPTRKAAHSIAGIALGSASGVPALGWAIYRLLRAATGECTRKCGIFAPNIPRRQHCLFKCKENIYQIALNKLKATKCTDEKCKQRVEKLKDMVEKKLSVMKAKVGEYQAFLSMKGKEGREPSEKETKLI